MSSKLNRKFEEVQLKIDGDSVGHRIAAEGNKKYLLIDRKELGAQENSSKNNCESPSLQGGFLLSDNESERSENDTSDFPADPKSSDMFSDINERQEVSIQVEGSYKRTILESHREDQIGSFGSSFLTESPREELLEKATEDDEDLVGPLKSAVFDIVSQTRSYIDCVADHSLRKEDSTCEEGLHAAETVTIATEGSITVRATERIDIASNESIEAATEEHFFYGSLHNDESEGEPEQRSDHSDLDNIEWQSESDHENSYSLGGDNNMDTSSSSADRSANATTGPTESGAAANSLVISSDIINRAMNTAANMADWAGRAVRMALKEHVQNVVY